jgi:hypothetical protein
MNSKKILKILVILGVLVEIAIGLLFLALDLFFKQIIIIFKKISIRNEVS